MNGLQTCVLVLAVTFAAVAISCSQSAKSASPYQGMAISCAATGEAAS